MYESQTILSLSNATHPVNSLLCPLMTCSMQLGTSLAKFYESAGGSELLSIDYIWHPERCMSNCAKLNRSKFSVCGSCNTVIANEATELGLETLTIIIHLFSCCSQSSIQKIGVK